MIWLGLLLVGVGIADLAHAVWRVRWLPELLGAVAVVALGLLAGYGSVGEIAVEVAIGLVVIAWGSAVRIGFGRGRPAIPLTLAIVAVLATIAISGYGDAESGPLQDWLDGAGLPLLAGLWADRVVLLAGAFLVQGSTGNVIVRLILQATHTVRPQERDQAEAGPRLKGGRLLGPMERLLILGLGLAGAYSAVGLVIAAKGLLRFPELQAARDATEGPSITEVTEYFLVGNFVSWTFALGTLALAAT